MINLSHVVNASFSAFLYILRRSYRKRLQSCLEYWEWRRRHTAAWILWIWFQFPTVSIADHDHQSLLTFQYWGASPICIPFRLAFFHISCLSVTSICHFLWILFSFFQWWKFIAIVQSDFIGFIYQLWLLNYSITSLMKYIETCNTKLFLPECELSDI